MAYKKIYTCDRCEKEMTFFSNYRRMIFGMDRYYNLCRKCDNEFKRFMKRK